MKLRKMRTVSEDFKKFIFFLIASIIVAFDVSYSYFAYQNYQQEKKLMKLKKFLIFKNFNFQENNKKIKNTKENITPQEIWQNERLETLKTLGYKKIDIKLFIRDYMIG